MGLKEALVINYLLAGMSRNKLNERLQCYQSLPYCKALPLSEISANTYKKREEQAVLPWRGGRARHKLVGGTTTEQAPRGHEEESGQALLGPEAAFPSGGGQEKYRPALLGGRRPSWRGDEYPKSDLCNN